MMKMKWILALLLLTGCALLKRTTKTTNETLDELQKESLLTASNRRSIVRNGAQQSYRIDSATADYRIYFWPKGTMNLGLGGSLIGEFDSVLLVGKMQQSSNTSQLANSTERLNDQQQSRLQESLAIKTEKKDEEKRSVYDAKWVTVIITLLLLVIFVIKKVMF